MSIEKMISETPRRRRGLQPGARPGGQACDVLRGDLQFVRRCLLGGGDGHAPLHPAVHGLRGRVTATYRIATRRTDHNRQLIRAMLATCIEACAVCEAECARHDNAHCRRCAQMCRGVRRRLPAGAGDVERRGSRRLSGLSRDPPRPLAQPATRARLRNQCRSAARKQRGLRHEPRALAAMRLGCMDEEGMAQVDRPRLARHQRFGQAGAFGEAIRRQFAQRSGPPRRLPQAAGRSRAASRSGCAWARRPGPHPTTGTASAAPARGSAR